RKRTSSSDSETFGVPVLYPLVRFCVLIVQDDSCTHHPMRAPLASPPPLLSPCWAALLPWWSGAGFFLAWRRCPPMTTGGMLTSPPQWISQAWLGSPPP